jgi:hypothetical protein
MSEKHTQDMPDSRSFEERVFARFDAIEARLQALEIQGEKRALETKPIWERALAEILEVKEGLADVGRKIDVLSRDIVRSVPIKYVWKTGLRRFDSKPA